MLLLARFLVGAIAGAAVGYAVNYFFSPAKDTTFDASYRSRLDWALDEGDKAAAAREIELRLQFEQAKRGIRQLPDNLNPNTRAQ